MSDRSVKKNLISIIKWLLIALILFFIARQITTQWELVKGYPWKINWVMLFLSLIVLQIGLFYKSLLWSKVLSCFGEKLPPMRAFRVAYLSNLGRYVPGKVFQFVGIMYLARKEGVREDIAVSSLALVQLMDTPAGIIAIFVYYLMLGLSFDKISHYMPLMILLGVISVAAILIILIPSLLERMLNVILRFIKRPRLEFKLEKKVGFQLLFLYFISWNIFGASLYLFLRAVTDIPMNFFLESCVVYAASYLVGYWALFAPGGIGVREGAMGVFLAEIGGIITPVALAVGLMSRLWFLAAELSVSVLALMIRSKKSNAQKEKN
jgi:glycosyltransferase 2 family protein